MAKIKDTITVKIKIVPVLSFWAAIKLRIAGEKYSELVTEFIKNQFADSTQETE